MDVHSIKSDLIAMEMELNYHDEKDENELDFEDMANSKTPKTSHGTRRLSNSSQTKKNEKDSTYEIKSHKQTRSQNSNYVSLALIDKHASCLETKTQTTNHKRTKLKNTKQNIVEKKKVLGERNYPTSSPSLIAKTDVQKEDTRNMIAFPTIQNLNGCSSMFSLEQAEDDYFFVMNTLVRVTVKLPNKKVFEFSQPGHVMIAREAEMKHVANMMQLNWSGSLVMKNLLKKKMSTRHNCGPNHHRQEISIVLEPEVQELDYSSIVWSPALQKSILRFYHSGVVSVFDDCSCLSMILALEFLEILYTPNHLTFESFGGYLKFKLWSDYFNYRVDIATWVKKSLVNYHSQHRYMFVTHPEKLKNASIYSKGQKCEQLDGGLLVWNEYSDEEIDLPNSCAVVHDLFAGDVEGIVLQDFKAYLQKELPGTKIGFSHETVTMHSPSSSTLTPRSLSRPLLCIELEERGSQKEIGYTEVPVSHEQRTSHYNRLDVSSITDQLSSYDVTEDSEETEESDESYNIPLRSHVTVDTMNAEWLVSVFLCKSSPDYSQYD